MTVPISDDIIGDEDEQQDEQRQSRLARIAPPNLPGSLPPANLRGLNVPISSSSSTAPTATDSSATTPGSTQDLEQRGIEARIRPAPIAKPSAIKDQTEKDEAELGRLKSTGSGISQIASPTKRGILRGLNVAGKVGAAVFPELYPVLNAIPGTEEHHNYLIRQQEGRLGEDLGAEKEEAATEESRAKGEEAESNADKAESEVRLAGQPKPKEEEWINVPTLTGPNGEPVEYEKNSGQYRYADLAGAKQTKTPSETAVQNKQAFQEIVGKVDAAGLPTDEKHLDKSLDAALKAGKITQDEHKAARGYLAANSTPSTNLSVRVAGAEATNAMKEAGKTYLYNGELVKGSQVPANADATPIKDPAAFQQEARNSDIIAKSFNHLVKDNHAIFDDAASRAVLATALDDHQAQQLGLLVAGTGGSLSLPGGSGKIIDELLENHAVPQNLRRSVKDYIVDYWAMKDKLAMVQMEMQQGKIGRGGTAYFQAMMSQLPGPATSDGTMARRQLKDLGETLSLLREQYGNLPKEKLSNVAGEAGGGGEDYGPAPAGKADGSTGTLPDGTHVVVKNGRIIGE